MLRMTLGTHPGPGRRRTAAARRRGPPPPQCAGSLRGTHQVQHFSSDRHAFSRKPLARIRVPAGEGTRAVQYISLRVRGTKAGAAGTCVRGPGGNIEVRKLDGRQHPPPHRQNHLQVIRSANFVDAARLACVADAGRRHTCDGLTRLNDSQRGGQHQGERGAPAAGRTAPPGSTAAAG